VGERIFPQGQKLNTPSGWRTSPAQQKTSNPSSKKPSSAVRRRHRRTSWLPRPAANLHPAASPKTVAGTTELTFARDPIPPRAHSYFLVADAPAHPYVHPKDHEAVRKDRTGNSVPLAFEAAKGITSPNAPVPPSGHTSPGKRVVKAGSAADSQSQRRFLGDVSNSVGDRGNSPKSDHNETIVELHIVSRQSPDPGHVSW